MGVWWSQKTRIIWVKFSFLPFFRTQKWSIFATVGSSVWLYSLNSTLKPNNLILKRSQLGAFCPQDIVYCYHEFKLRYLKNQKLFSIRVKELFESILLQKSDRFLLFLKAFSWDTDLWVTLSDFTVKTQNWEGKSVFNWKSIKLKRNVLCCR